jgi:hypothetical protein
MGDSEQTEIVGKHNLGNPSFRLAVLKKGLEILNYLEIAEESAFRITDLVISGLNLPSSEKIIVMNALAPKSPTVKKEYLVEAIALLEQANTNKELPQTCDTTAENDSKVVFSPLGELKTKILSVVEEKKIVPCSYLTKHFGDDLRKVHCSLSTFLSIQFTTSELIQSQDIVAVPGYEPSMNALTKQILDENHHQPFNVNVLGERFGLSPDEVKTKLRKKELSTFVQWSPYETWSLHDAVTTDEAKKKIQRSVAISSGGPVLLSDIFHCMFVGIVAENLYNEIDENARIQCAQKGLQDSGFHDFTFNKTQMAFTKNGQEGKPSVRKPLYKVF